MLTFDTVDTAATEGEGRTLDAEEFSSQVAADYPRLVRALTAFCGDPAVAEDAVQDALVVAWTRLDRGDEVTSLSGFAAVTAMNRIRSHLRRRGAEARAVERLGAVARSTVPDPAEAPGRGGELLAAVAALPDRQRQVTVLHHLLGFDLASLADLLGVSVGACKHALFSARSSLRSALDPEGTRDG